uniref:Alpha-crystallin (Acr) (14 kDa antigen) (16 kDa antigen) (HSP 16.3) (Nox16) n=1 Tax=Ganoderma boninense TaxID=34458 RepID=A0A5K1K2L2_9APHY|nr:Alpha-crystallin (Acr) (14 kDa antigen) (16 kDa antigen) (HSP 16.3) (Nox16) [Ganoderma boninense]
MSMTTFFNEPFYTLSDFDRLFDEAFNARTSVSPRAQVENVATRPMRPRYVSSPLPPSLAMSSLYLPHSFGGADADAARMDLHEDKDQNMMTAQFELPGLTKQDVNIDLRDNVLTISGECAMEADRDEHGYSVRERRFGKFARSLPVPQGIKADEVKANMNHGVLTVTFPRSTPEQAPKKITIA